MVQYCQNCGNEIVATDSFCKSCGEELLQRKGLIKKGCATMEIKDGIVSMSKHEFDKTQTWTLLVGVALGVVFGISLIMLINTWL